jgi:hypothetical protein
MDITQHMQLELDIRELEHLGGTYTGTIKTVREGYVLTFEETGHQLQLNWTFSQSLRYAHGDETDLWKGKRIEVSIYEGKRGTRRRLTPVEHSSVQNLHHLSTPAAS